LSRLPDLSEEQRQRIDLMTRALVKKLLHTPTQLLKQSSGEGSAAEYAVLARRLFGLSAQPGRGELQEGT
jgi:glutamyl-tRNA reductase